MEVTGGTDVCIVHIEKRHTRWNMRAPCHQHTTPTRLLWCSQHSRRQRSHAACAVVECKPRQRLRIRGWVVVPADAATWAIRPHVPQHLQRVGAVHKGQQGITQADARRGGWQSWRRLRSQCVRRQQWCVLVAAAALWQWWRQAAMRAVPHPAPSSRRWLCDCVERTTAWQHRVILTGLRKRRVWCWLQQLDAPKEAVECLECVERRWGVAGEGVDD